MSNGCFAHDAHNAFKWSVIAYISDRDTMKAAWVCMESLRESYDLLVLQLPTWLGLVLTFEDYLGPSMGPLWSLVGIIDPWLSLLVNLGVRWEDNRLKVNSQYAQDPDILQLVSMILLHVWKWKSWSTSRWCGVGQSCRKLLASLLLGLESLTESILAKKKKIYYLKGFKKKSTDIKRMVCVVVGSSQVSEVAVYDILKDNRLARHLADIEQAVDGEVAKAMQVSGLVLQQLAATCGLTTHSLHDEVCTAAMIQRGYLASKLREVHGWPWKLCRGNVLENLENLKRGEKPDDDTAGKIWELMRLEWPVDDIAKGVKLLGECPFTTLVVEQGHSISSSIMKLHPAYGSATMQARVAVITAKVLFTKSPQHMRIEREKMKLQILRRKRPQCLTGRQMFVSGLIGEAKMQLASGARLNLQKTARSVIKRHGPRWRKLGPSDKQRFELLAGDRRQEVEDELVLKIEEKRATIRNMQQQIKDHEAQGGSCLLMDRCRKSDTEIARFDLLYEAEQWTHEGTAVLREDISIALGPPKRAVMATLSLMDVWEPRRGRRQAPAWVPWACHNREYFNKAVIRATRPDGEVQCIKFVFALQSPALARGRFLTMDEDVAHWLDLDAGDELDLNIWDHTFRYAGGGFIFSDEEYWPAEEQIEVMPDVVHRDGALCADGD